MKRFLLTLVAILSIAGTIHAQSPPFSQNVTLVGPSEVVLTPGYTIVYLDYLETNGEKQNQIFRDTYQCESDNDSRVYVDGTYRRGTSDTVRYYYDGTVGNGDFEFVDVWYGGTDNLTGQNLVPYFPITFILVPSTTGFTIAYSSGTNPVNSCSKPLGGMKYHSGSGSAPAVGDYIFSDQNGSLFNGQGYFYAIANDWTIKIGTNGKVLLKEECLGEDPH